MRIRNFIWCGCRSGCGCRFGCGCRSGCRCRFGCGCRSECGSRLPIWCESYTYLFEKWVESGGESLDLWEGGGGGLSLWGWEGGAARARQALHHLALHHSAVHLLTSLDITDKWVRGKSVDSWSFFFIWIYIWYAVSLRTRRFRIRIYKYEVPGTDPDPFYHQANIVRKTLTPTLLWFFLWLFIFKKWFKCSFDENPGLDPFVRMKENLCLFQCCGSVIFWYRFGSSDPSRIRKRIREALKHTDPEHWHIYIILRR